VSAIALSVMGRTGTAAEAARRIGARILIVEAEVTLADALRARLKHQNFSVEVSSTPRKARSAYERCQPDLLLFDVDGSGTSGWKLVQTIRARDSIPILIISERAGQQDKVSALELGADDYVTKPLPMEELLARIRVALRRMQTPPQGAVPTVRVGDLEIDWARQRVVQASRLVHLTPTESALLRLFTLHIDKLLTERMLLEAIWGRLSQPSRHMLHVNIGRLRKKLEPDPEAPSYLITEPGAGYRLVTDATAASAELA
jgi:two-component system KDP operon response regulator KdpE